MGSLIIITILKLTVVHRYKAVEQSSEATGINAPASWGVQDIQAWLKEQAASLDDDVSPDVSRDLFEQGFDRYVNRHPL